MSQPDTREVYDAPIDRQLQVFVDQHREALVHCLDGLTEAEARARLVPSSTTLLGLVRHAAFVERVWFGQAVTGGTRAELGIPESPDASFQLSDADTIATAVAHLEAAISASRAAVAGMDLDTVLTGNRRGDLPLRWVLLHVLREHAQHCGHADILREQVLTRRAPA